MAESVVVTIGDTYGLAFIGLIISIAYVVSLFPPYLPELIHFQPLWCDDGSDVSGETYHPQAVNLHIEIPIFSDGCTTGNRLSSSNVDT